MSDVCELAYSSDQRLRCGEQRIRGAADGHKGGGPSVDRDLRRLRRPRPIGDRGPHPCLTARRWNSSFLWVLSSRGCNG